MKAKSLLPKDFIEESPYTYTSVSTMAMQLLDLGDSWLCLLPVHFTCSLSYLLRPAQLFQHQALLFPTETYDVHADESFFNHCLFRVFLNYEFSGV